MARSFISRRAFLGSTLSSLALQPVILNVASRPARAEPLTAIAAVGLVAAIGKTLVSFMKRNPASHISQAQMLLLNAILTEVRAMNVQLQNISVQIERLFTHVAEVEFKGLETELYAGMASAWLGLLERRTSRVEAEAKAELFDKNAYFQDVRGFYNQFSDYRRRLTVLGELDDFRGIAHLVIAQELEQAFIYELTSIEAYQFGVNVNLGDGKAAAGAYLKYFEKALRPDNSRALPGVEAAALEKLEAARNTARRFSHIRGPVDGTFEGDVVLTCQTFEDNGQYECGSNSNLQRQSFPGFQKKGSGWARLFDAGYCFYSHDGFKEIRMKMTFEEIESPVVLRKLEIYNGAEGVTEGSLNKFPAYQSCPRRDKMQSLQDRNNWLAANFSPMDKAVTELNIAESDYYGAKALREAVELAALRTSETIDIYNDPSLSIEAEVSVDE